MASPIRWFRKHSQFFIVVFGVLLMAIFGLGSVFTSLSPSAWSGGNRSEDKVFANWSGGKIMESDLERMRFHHFASLRLINAIRNFAINQNDGKEFPINADLIRPIQGGNMQNTVAGNEEVMFRHLSAKRAEEEGFKIDEDAVLGYLTQFAGNVPLTRTLLKRINKETNPRTPLAAVIKQLQTELTWLQFENMANAGMPFAPSERTQVPIASVAINPTEAIQMYARTSRKIECQVLPISIEEYVDNVTEEPSESELRELYEAGKNRYPDEFGDQPGFKVFRQANIQYFVASQEAFLENEMAKLTVEEVQQEYDRLVEAEDRLVMEVVPDESDSNDTADADAGDATESEEDSAPAPDASGDSVEENDPAPAPAEATEDQPESDSAEGGSEAEAPKTNTVLKQDETESESASPADPAGDSDVQNDATNEPNQESATDTEADDSSDSETAPPTDADSGDDGQQTDPVIADDKQERRPRPLSEVADAIKRQMKSEDARKAREAAIEEAEKELLKFQMKRSRYDSMQLQGGGDSDSQPDSPDFQKIADDLKLEYLQTGLIDQTEVDDEKIGQVVTIDANRRPNYEYGQSIFQSLELLDLYDPIRVNDLKSNSLIMFWIAEKTDQKIPTFKEARESIVEYWKKKRGLEQALAAAEEIATRVNDSDKSLKEIEPDRARDTGAFAWFSTFGTFDYGTPATVRSPGEEFMSVAFQLDDREAGVAMNTLRDTVYVIQNTTPEPTELEQVGADYIENKFFREGRLPFEVRMARGEYRSKFDSKWIEEFKDSIDLELIGR